VTGARKFVCNPVRAGRTVAKNEPLVPRLRYGGREIVCRRHDGSITRGRDPASGVVVNDARVSRHHCTIERRQDKFVLTDRSTNGAYITAEGSAEIFLRREELFLGKRRWIAFGQPRAEAQGVVEYFCS